MLTVKRAARLAAIAIIIVPLVFALTLARYVHTPIDVADGAVLVVEPGSTARDVSALIARAGLGKWKLGNLVGMRLWSEPSSIKAGAYSFSGDVAPIDVFTAMAEGRVMQVSVTLPEGLTAREMGALLEDAGVTGSAEFVALAYDPASPERFGVPGPTLEGYLFPDTYKFAHALDAVVVIKAMTDKFKEVAASVSPSMQAGELDLKQWVTLASVVEKETGAPGERKLVASVFANRLKLNMRLESDPTVIYGIENFDGNIRKRDLRADTPYNTYTRKGLPPGPIANPGRESLEAVLNPAETEYLYFVSRNDGTHFFSSTYSEHSKAVRRFQLRGGK